MYVDQATVTAIATQLGTRADQLGGPQHLGERKDLEPETTFALSSRHQDRVEKERKVTVPEWPHVGNVDVIIRKQPASPEFSAVVELKWCRRGESQLGEVVWDMVKLALLSCRSDAPEAFLLFGASQAAWSQSSFSDLFDSGEHPIEALLARDFGLTHYLPVWQAMLDGGYGHYPESIPAAIRTTQAGRATLHDWELRCVRVEQEGSGLFPMIDGWPHGRRPAH